MPIPAETYGEVHLLPSILSADFSRLGEQVALVMDAGVRIIHVDIMDGHFVPNLTIGPAVLQSLAPMVHGRGGLFSVHLMIERPEEFVDDFVRAGADAVSVHVEACSHLYHAVTAIKDLGAGAGVAINPGTPVSAVREVEGLVDFFLVMTVNPGFGGQQMIEPALDKVAQLRRSVPKDVAIEVDGGVHEANIRRVVDLGANWVVAGSAVFGAAHPDEEARKLQRLMLA
jgi:ribulose-phosphate 3-epimerase